MIRWYAFRDRSTGVIVAAMGTERGFYPICVRDATDETVDRMIEALPEQLPVVHCKVKRWEVASAQL